MNLTLVSLSLISLLAALGNSIANVGLPTLALAFAASFQQVQWVVLAYLLAITTLIVSMGRLGDLIGRRRLLLYGLGVFTMASLACALAPALPWLVAARAVQGMGAAVMMALTMALVGDTVPKAQTGRAMGVLATMSAIGTALGPSLGGLLIAGFGWRSVFYVLVVPGAVALLLAWRGLPADKPTAAPGQFDHRGTLVLAATLGCYGLAMTLGRGNFAVANLLLLLGAAGGVALFVSVQRRAPAPLIHLPMLRQPGLRAGLVMSALVLTVMMALLVVGPFYLDEALGLTPVQAGLVLAAGPVMAALAGMPAGACVDRFGARRVTVGALAVMVPGLVMLAMLPGRWGAPAYVLSYCTITAGYALFQTANSTGIISDAAPAQRGVVSGLLNMARNLGMITGASAMGAVFVYGASRVSAGAGGATSAQAVTAGMRLTLGVSVLLVLAALAVGTRWLPVSATSKPIL